MAFDRRNLFQGILASAGFATAGRALARHAGAGPPQGRLWQPRAGIVGVHTPDLSKMPWRMEDGAKTFHIVAEPVRTEFVKGRAVDAWGYNGSVPGPTIEVNEGDRVRIVVRQPPARAYTPPLARARGADRDGRRRRCSAQDPIPPGGRSSTSSRSTRTARSSTTRTCRCRR